MDTTIITTVPICHQADHSQHFAREHACLVTKHLVHRSGDAVIMETGPTTVKHSHAMVS